MERRAGIIQVSINGTRIDAKGEFTYNLGRPKREPIVGDDGIHGYTETPQVGYIEGALTDSSNLDLDAMLRLEDATVTLGLAVGPGGPQKTIVARSAVYAGDGEAKTREGEIQFRVISGDMEEA
jgi:hypothetical protein